MRSFSAKGVVFICLAHASFFPPTASESNQRHNKKYLKVVDRALARPRLYTSAVGDVKAKLCSHIRTKCVLNVQNNNKDKV